MPSPEALANQANWRCDTCGVKHSVSPISWTYRTPSHASERVRAAAAEVFANSDRRVGIESLPDIEGEPPGTVFQDEEWGVCQPCHELMAEGALRGLIERNVRQSGLVVVGDDPVVRLTVAQAQAEVMNILAAFWVAKEPNPTREPS